jgi:hypothetical protein
LCPFEGSGGSLLVLGHFDARVAQPLDGEAGAHPNDLDSRC